MGLGLYVSPDVDYPVQGIQNIAPGAMRCRGKVAISFLLMPGVMTKLTAVGPATIGARALLFLRAFA